MVYFLEVARQCYMQIAHSHLRIPLNTPMNLLALSFTTDRPIPGTVRCHWHRKPVLTHSSRSKPTASISTCSTGAKKSVKPALQLKC